MCKRWQREKKNNNQRLKVFVRERMRMVRRGAIVLWMANANNLLP